tara:strand:- start:586 stop:1617 length:1032 start_codon:yes stop_codon:yes gene_type:complete
MNLAVVWDYSGYVNSFYIKDGVAHSFKDNKPYMYTHAISPECFLMGPASFPWLYGDGYFLNLSEWEDGLPDLDLDIILYSCEHKGLLNENYDNYRVSRLRKKYPNAKIIGLIKEWGVNFNNQDNFSEEKYKNRIDYLNESDAIGILLNLETFNELPEAKTTIKDLNKPLQFLESPMNTDYLCDNFYKPEKELSIYAYLPHQHHRRGDTYEFVKYISEKYQIQVRFKSLQNGQKFDYLSQKQFIELWSPSLFHFNLDPLRTQPGQQCKQVACVGSINIGGLNNSHMELYPETATNDRKVLEEKFVEYMEDENKRGEVVQKAWDRVNELYSHTAVRKQIGKLFYE